MKNGCKGSGSIRLKELSTTVVVRDRDSFGRRRINGLKFFRWHVWARPWSVGETRRLGVIGSRRRCWWWCAWTVTRRKIFRRLSGGGAAAAPAVVGCCPAMVVVVDLIWFGVGGGLGASVCKFHLVEVRR
ncbi:hypothetical protein Salat_2959600 [Sesamum alatum]|uniref:Transmembrane protein n=1 Tax=Sesamum alatum TaxID=300844 RepID=A0AAE1XJZ8_9LAMI|nr:hypothetical protein Salat_2959600 [Sesamum alatum]